MYVDLVLLEASFPSGFGEGFLFSRVILCSNVISSLMMGWSVCRGGCGMCEDDVCG